MAVVRLPVLSHHVSVAALELAANDERAAARSPARPRALAVTCACALVLAQDAPAREPADDAADPQNVARAPRQRRKWSQREPLPLPADFVALDGPPPPRCRAIVRQLARPCPFIECPMHLWSVAPSERQGGVKANGFAVRRFTEQSCAHDVIDAQPSGVTELEIANLLGLSRRRVEQIMDSAARKLAADPDARALLDEIADENGSKPPRAAHVRARFAVPRSA